MFSTSVQIEKDALKKEFQRVGLEHKREGEYNFKNLCRLIGITQPTYNRALKEGVLRISTLNKMKEAGYVDITKFVK